MAVAIEFLGQWFLNIKVKETQQSTKLMRIFHVQSSLTMLPSKNRFIVHNNFFFFFFFFFLQKNEISTESEHPF